MSENEKKETSAAGGADPAAAAPAAAPGAPHASAGAAAAPAEVSGFKMIATMGGVGLASAVLIAATFQFTLPHIKENQRKFLEKSIFKVLPGAVKRRTFKLKGDALVELKGEDEKAFKVYAGYDKRDRLIGVAVGAQGQGFQDVLKLLYGYAPDRKCVVGMKVLESRETPGLGDKIETDPEFVANFKCLDVALASDGKKMLHPIELVKRGAKTKKWEVDAITGATISSRAVANILGKSSAEIVPIIKRNITALKIKKK